MKKIKDNFSKQAELYQQFRPGYPEKLIALLCDHITNKNLAWDCASGNGQIAKILAQKFEKVIATDISAEQLKKAPRQANIDYRVERAEHTSLPDASVDLIVVAQAIHWFDFKHFYAEAKRVLKKDGVIAIIGYPFMTSEESELNEIISFFNNDVVGNYWDAERKYVDERYSTIPFPFAEFQLPKFEMKYHWNLEQITGYISSWSAVSHYQKKTGANPLELIKIPLRKIFDTVNQVEVRFEIIGRYGKF